MLKKLFLLIIAVIALINVSNGQDIIASTAKIGQLNLKMNNLDVEKVIKKAIPKSDLIKCDTSYYYYIKLKIDSVDYDVRFQKQYDSLGIPLSTYKVFSIKCNSIKVKTKSGLTIGMNKFKAMEILDKTKVLYGYSKSLDYSTETNSDKLVEKFTFIDNKTYDILMIYLKDGVIESFELTWEIMDECK